MNQRESGISLLEVAIAGAILLAGLATISQLVRNTLDTTSQDPSSAQFGPIVEHSLRLQASNLKGSRNLNAPAYSNRTSVSTESIYTYFATRSVVQPLAVGMGAGSFELVEYEVWAKMTVSNRATMSTDPVVGYTRFWKLRNTANDRTGL